jgi:hypothetical protein
MSRLPDHLQPPAIVETLTRYECPRCGNNCQCGVPYVPKTVRAAEAIAAAPEKSNRMLAKETGLSEPTIRRARASDDAPATVTGRDGKSYPATKLRTDNDEVVLVEEAHRYLDKIVDLLRQMDRRQRVNFRTVALQQMADAYLDEDVIEF